MKDKSDLELRYKLLESELNFLSAKKSSLEDGSKLIRREISRIEDNLDQITKELISLVEVLRKC